MIRQLAHLCFYTNRIEEMVRFYRDSLGLPVKFTLNDDNGPSSLFRHFCLEVTGLDDFKQALEKRGMQVSAITMGMDNSRQAWIADPDGNAIELMEYTHHSLQLRRPQLED